MRGNSHQAVSIAAAGVATGLTSSSANLALPTCSDGKKPRYIRVATNGTIHVRLGVDNTVTAATTDTLVNVSEPLIMNAAGFSYIAGIADSGTPSLQVSALDDGSCI